MGAEIWTWHLGDLMTVKALNGPATPVVMAGGGGLGGGTALGYQQITSLAAAAGLTVPPGATYAVISPGAQAVRWRDDGTNPTATVGMPIPVNGVFTYAGDLTAIKFIEQAASAQLNISYYK